MHAGKWLTAGHSSAVWGLALSGFQEVLVNQAKTLPVGARSAGPRLSSGKGFSVSVSTLQKPGHSSVQSRSIAPAAAQSDFITEIKINKETIGTK